MKPLPRQRLYGSSEIMKGYTTPYGESDGDSDSSSDDDNNSGYYRPGKSRPVRHRPSSPPLHHSAYSSHDESVGSRRASVASNEPSTGSKRRRSSSPDQSRRRFHQASTDSEGSDSESPYQAMRREGLISTGINKRTRSVSPETPRKRGRDRSPSSSPDSSPDRVRYCRRTSLERSPSPPSRRTAQNSDMDFGFGLIDLNSGSDADSDSDAESPRTKRRRLFQFGRY